MSLDGSDLIFVNKDSNSRSLTRSEGGEKAFILSHVQRQRRNRAKNSSRTPQPWSKHITHLPTRQKTLQSEQSSGNDDMNTQELTVALPQSPKNNGFDPFFCTIASMDAGNHSMLHFTFTRGAKRTFLAEAFAPSSKATAQAHMRHDKIIMSRLKRCVVDKALMYSTLAYGSSCLAWMGGVVAGGHSPEYYIGQALEAVRLRLARSSDVQIDNWLILSIYGLAITAFWNCSPNLWIRCPERYADILQRKIDQEDPRLHLRAILKLVNSAGGWMKFDKYVLESALLADKYLTLRDLTPPVIPPSWDPDFLASLSDNSNRFPDTPSLPVAFRNLQLPSGLLVCISDITKYVTFAEDYWSKPVPSPTTEHILFLRLQAITYRLLSLSALTGVEECVRLSVIIFLLNTTEYHGAQVSASTVLNRLRSALVSARFWDHSFDDGVKFWCLVTGAMGTVASSDRDWFVAMVYRYYGGFVTADMAFERLGRYLFIYGRQKEQVLRLWEKLSTS